MAFLPFELALQPTAHGNVTQTTNLLRADSGLGNFTKGYKMTQASDISQKKPSDLYSNDTYTDRRARMFESSAKRHAQRHGALSGTDAIKLSQDLVKIEGNKDELAS